MFLGRSIKFGDTVHICMHLAQTLTDGGVGDEALHRASAISTSQAAGVEQVVSVELLGRLLLWRNHEEVGNRVVAIGD